jgi:hypothetical protein
MDDLLLVRKSHEVVHTPLFHEGGLRGALVERAFYAAVRAKPSSVFAHVRSARSLRSRYPIPETASFLAPYDPLVPHGSSSPHLTRSESFAWSVSSGRPRSVPLVPTKPTTHAIHAMMLTTPPYSHTIQVEEVAR